MNKPPAFQFYADDFLGGTIHFTDAEIGLYMRLLCVQWNNGGLPDDDVELASYGKGGTPLPRVKAKFKKCEDGRLRNERMESERQKQTEYRESQSHNGKTGAQKRWHRHSDANGGAIATPMANTMAKHSSPSPSPSPSPLSKNISFDAVRIANRIICNQDSWQYDNCKVVSDDLKTKPLASVIEPMLADGRSEAEIIRDWCKAVYIAHGATVDGLAKNPVAYAITAFKDEATK